LEKNSINQTIHARTTKKGELGKKNILKELECPHSFGSFGTK
jgi:hypothetical protein